MADFTNKQLAEIISATSEEIKKSVLNQRKIANELLKLQQQFTEENARLNDKIKDLKETSIKPDLSNLNNFYEEKTAENVKRLNSRLQVPNLAVYVWLTSVIMFLLSGLFIWYSSKSKQEIITEYNNSLEKENKVIIPKENKKTFDDMINFFERNPKTKVLFIKSRGK